jgi:hypothetical protein
LVVGSLQFFYFIPSDVSKRADNEIIHATLSSVLFKAPERQNMDQKRLRDANLEIYASSQQASEHHAFSQQ